MRWAAAAIAGVLLAAPPAVTFADQPLPAPRPGGPPAEQPAPTAIPAAAGGLPATAGAAAPVAESAAPDTWPTAERWEWATYGQLPQHRPPPSARPAAEAPAAAPPGRGAAGSPAAAGTTPSASPPAANPGPADRAPAAKTDVPPDTSSAGPQLPRSAPARVAAPAAAAGGGADDDGDRAPVAEAAAPAGPAAAPGPEIAATDGAVALPRPAPARDASPPPAADDGMAAGASAAADVAAGDPAAAAAPDPKPPVLAYAPAPGEARPSPRSGERERGPLLRTPSPERPAATPAPTTPGAPPIGAPTAPPAATAAATGGGCVALLALGPAVVEAAPDLPQSGACGVERPVRLKAVKMPDGRLVALSPVAELRCDMAAAATAWLRDDLVPALEAGGPAVVAVKVADDYSCRPRNRVKGARLSEHGKGNAIDIGGFKLADGRVLEVAGNGLPKPFRITMRATACARFKTILGPGSDGYHENHIHVDLASRRSKRSYCRWRIPGTDAS